MVSQPIINEAGDIVDEYELPEESSNDAESESTEGQEHHVGSEAESAPTPSPTPPVVRVQKEDPTDFDQSDVSIQILLHRVDGDPQGRLVSFIIHNFSGVPLIQDLREAELTDKSRLDSIHKAIYPLMQRFLLDLAGRKQKKLEEEAKRAPKPTPHKAVGPVATPPAAVPLQVPVQQAPTTSTTKPPSSGNAAATHTAQPAAVGKEEAKKKDKQPKYQSIPMF